VLAQIEMDDDENFTPEQIKKFRTDPELYLRFVKAVEKQVNNNFPIVRAWYSMLHLASANVR
jgi:hypothetical protein